MVTVLSLCRERSGRQLEQGGTGSREGVSSGRRLCVGVRQQTTEKKLKIQAVGRDHFWSEPPEKPASLGSSACRN